MALSHLASWGCLSRWCVDKSSYLACAPRGSYRKPQAYVAISLDATGLFRFLAFWVARKGGTSGRRLYFYLYLFFLVSAAVVGNVSHRVQQRYHFPSMTCPKGPSHPVWHSVPGLPNEGIGVSLILPILYYVSLRGFIESRLQPLGYSPNSQLPTWVCVNHLWSYFLRIYRFRSVCCVNLFQSDQSSLIRSIFALICHLYLICGPPVSCGCTGCILVPFHCAVPLHGVYTFKHRGIA